MIVGTLVSIGVNTGAFFALSKLLPGFNVKNEKTALIMAVAYSVVGFVASLFLVPLAAIGAIFCAFLAFIPLIGPLLAASSLLFTVFVVFFTLTVGLLVMIDKLMDDFKMQSFGVAVMAAILLGIINVVVRALLPF